MNGGLEACHSTQKQNGAGGEKLRKTYLEGKGGPPRPILSPLTFRRGGKRSSGFGWIIWEVVGGGEGEYSLKEGILSLLIFRGGSIGWGPKPGGNGVKPELPDELEGGV